MHFLGKLPYARYLALLQVSSAHVYLTVPFVLSWSMLEAMAAGCLVIGSDTPPVREVLRHGENGLLVDFFSPGAIAAAVDEVFGCPERMGELRRAARETVVEGYDIRQSIACYMKVIERLTAVGTAPGVEAIWPETGLPGDSCPLQWQTEGASREAGT